MLALKDRQSHLEVMGVHQWYARTKLAGAQSTPDWVLVDTAVPVSKADFDQNISPTNAPSPAVSKKDAGRTKSAMDILGGLRSAEDKSHTVADNSSSDRETGVSVSKIEKLPSLAGERALDSFSLVLYKTSQGLILSESISGQSHPTEFLLLKNILKSKRTLTTMHKDCLYQQQFNWPVFRSLNLQSKQDNELPNLMASWLMSYCNQSIKSVLYFGSAFSDVRRFYAELLASTDKSISFNSFKYSLAELIQFPQRKAEIWADICSLYGE